MNGKNIDNKKYSRTPKNSSDSHLEALCEENTVITQRNLLVDIAPTRNSDWMYHNTGKTNWTYYLILLE